MINSSHLRPFCGCQKNRQLHLNSARPQTYPGVSNFDWSVVFFKTIFQILNGRRWDDGYAAGGVHGHGFVCLLAWVCVFLFVVPDTIFCLFCVLIVVNFLLLFFVLLFV